MLADTGIDILYFRTALKNPVMVIPLCEIFNGDFEEWHIGKKTYASKLEMQKDIERALNVQITEFVIKKHDNSNEFEVSKFLERNQ